MRVVLHRPPGFGNEFPIAAGPDVHSQNGLRQQAAVVDELLYGDGARSSVRSSAEEDSGVSVFSGRVVRSDFRSECAAAAANAGGAAASKTAEAPPALRALLDASAAAPVAYSIRFDRGKNSATLRRTANADETNPRTELAALPERAERSLELQRFDLPRHSPLGERANAPHAQQLRASRRRLPPSVVRGAARHRFPPLVFRCNFGDVIKSTGATTELRVSIRRLRPHQATDGQGAAETMLAEWEALRAEGYDAPADAQCFQAGVEAATASAKLCGYNTPMLSRSRQTNDRRHSVWSGDRVLVSALLHFPHGAEGEARRDAQPPQVRATPLPLQCRAAATACATSAVVLGSSRLYSR